MNGQRLVKTKYGVQGPVAGKNPLDKKTEEIYERKIEEETMAYQDELKKNVVVLGGVAVVAVLKGTAAPFL